MGGTPVPRDGYSSPRWGRGYSSPRWGRGIPQSQIGEYPRMGILTWLGGILRWGIPPLRDRTAEEYLLRGGQYASCVHAGELSSYKYEIGFIFPSFYYRSLVYVKRTTTSSNFLFRRKIIVKMSTIAYFILQF